MCTRTHARTHARTHVTERLLQLGKRGPDFAIGGKRLELFLIDGAHAVDVAKLQLELDVALEHLVLRRRAYRAPEDLDVSKHTYMHACRQTD